jgi:hypothetical protein
VIGEVIAAIVGALIGTVVVAYYSRQQMRLAKEQAASEREKRSRKSAALFLEAIAQAMSGMATKLKAKEVPTFEGNTFTNLLESYEDAVRQYLGDQVREDIDRLKELAYRTQDIDPALRVRLRDLVPEGASLDPEVLQSSLEAARIGG